MTAQGTKKSNSALLRLKGQSEFNITDLLEIMRHIRENTTGIYIVWSEQTFLSAESSKAPHFQFGELMYLFESTVSLLATARAKIESWDESQGIPFVPPFVAAPFAKKIGFWLVTWPALEWSFIGFHCHEKIMWESVESTIACILYDSWSLHYVMRLFYNKFVNTEVFLAGLVRFHVCLGC